MAPIIEQVVSLLSTPEGFLIYALVLGLCTFAALISCIYAEGNQDSETGRRMQRGLMLLFILQLVLLLSALLGWLGNNVSSFLPPLDTSLALLSLVVIIWLWAYFKPDRKADLAVAIVAAVGVVFGLLNIVIWQFYSADVFFNSTIMGMLSYSLGIILLIVGIILLVVRRPGYWGFGIAMMAIMLGGYIAQLVLGDSQANYATFVHLGDMVGFIFILALPQRLVDLQQISVPAQPLKQTSIEPALLSPQLVQSITNLLTHTSPQEYYQELTRAIAHGMNADTCLLLLPQKAGLQIMVPEGYNRLEDKLIEGLALDGQKLPSIVEAIKMSKILQMSKANGQELRALTERLGGKPIGQLILVPFQPKGTNLEMGLAVLIGAAVAAWNEHDAGRLMETTQQLVSMAGQYSKRSGTPAEQAEMAQKLQHAEAAADQVRLEYAQLKAKYDAVSAGGAVAAPLAVETAVLVENQKNLQETITQLETRNRELEKLVSFGRPSIEEVEQLRQELRAALVDLARMPSTLSKSDQKMLELQLSTVKHLDDLQPAELVHSIAQEFRQPLSSILGYTDLLLGESVGLLGAVQRKFVERVKASAERCSILLNELVQVMSIDGGEVDQTMVSVDLKPVIDEAAKNLAAQISEKNISLRVELPDNPPPILVNKDALLQIMENLIENAYLITPSDGQIRLLARIEQRENLQSYMHISVSDQGGGIEKADLSRVFLRRYKMENPHIQGIGDMGVGLSIVKSLVELNKGRIWVDSKEGVGSTYSVLLPLAEEKPKLENPQASAGS
jgi:signal transduction histidine kinase